MRKDLSSSHEICELARCKEFLRSRRLAGRVVDVETCEIEKFEVNVADPYGVDPDPAVGCVGRLLFVEFPESEGCVCVHDLPEDKRRALYARIARSEQITPEAVCDVLLQDYARAIQAGLEKKLRRLDPPIEDRDDLPF